MAGVAINLTIGNNGIFTKAQQSVEMNRWGSVNDQVEMWKADVQLAKISNEKYETEDEMLQRLISEGQIKEEEINRTEKNITIAGKEISYKLEETGAGDLEPVSGKEDMILVANADVGSEVKIYFNNWSGDYNYNFTIDWGDGKKDTPEQGLSENDVELTHTYEEQGIYNITISGICEYFLLNESNIITEIKQWGTLNLKHVSFGYSENLIKVATPTKSSLVNVESFYSLFAGCDKLNSMPENLFDNCKKVHSFKGAFNSCIELEGTAPNLWDRVENGEENGYVGVPDGDGCFYLCEKLQNYDIIPDYWKQKPTPE